MSEYRGFFITFEGPEGAGKSSQVAKLAEYLQSRGRKCILTREPGGTGLAEIIRQVIKSHCTEEKVHDETELLLLEAARAQHVREKILPALNEGHIVICDRFTDSTSAYQGGARQMSIETIQYLNAFASAGRKPDLTFLLDLPPETGFARISARESEGYDRFENEKLDFHRLVRKSFLDLAAKEPERIHVVNAEDNIEKIAEKIRKVIDVALF